MKNKLIVVFLSFFMVFFSISCVTPQYKNTDDSNKAQKVIKNQINQNTTDNISERIKQILIANEGKDSSFTFSEKEEKSSSKKYFRYSLTSVSDSRKINLSLEAGKIKNFTYLIEISIERIVNKERVTERIEIRSSDYKHIIKQIESSIKQ